MNKIDERKRKKIEKLEKQLFDNYSPHIAMSLAEKYSDLGNFERAEEILKKSLEIDSKNISLKLAYARVRMDKHELLTAAEIVTEVLAEWPDDKNALRFRDVLEKRIQKMNNNEDDNYSSDQSISQANELLLNNKIEEALSIFKILLDANPDDEEAKNGFRHAYTRLVQSSKAAAEAELNESELMLNSLTKVARYFEAMKKVIQIRYNTVPDE